MQLAERSEAPFDLVLFDLGGVLFPDPWETLLLTPEVGIADQLGMDQERARRAGAEIWPAHATTRTDEAAYWSDFARLTGTKVPADLLTTTRQALMHPNPDARLLLDGAVMVGADVGIISDNTSFWFAMQASALRLSSYADEKLTFLSFEIGVRKANGLYDVAAQRVGSARTLVVDDRPHNLERAERAGFSSSRYTMGAASRAERDRLLAKLRW